MVHRSSILCLLFPISLIACSSYDKEGVVKSSIAPYAKAYKIRLEQTARIKLSDEKAPIKWLSALSFMEDGSFLECDKSSRLIRRFSSRGDVLLRLSQTDMRVQQWDPVRIDTVGQNLYVLNRELIFRFPLSEPTKVINIFSNPYLGPHFMRVDSNNRLILSGQPLLPEAPTHYIHIIAGGQCIKHFHEIAQDVSLTHSFEYPCIAIDKADNIVTLERITGKLNVYSPTGVLTRQCVLTPSPAFKAYNPDIGPDPREIQGQRDWLRGFSVFWSLDYLKKSDLLLVFERNDNPPTRPSHLCVYGKNGELFKYLPVSGYYVGMDMNENIYFCDQDRDIAGQCWITRYALIIGA